MSTPLLLVRRPSPLLSSGQLTHLSPSTDPPNHARSLAQWQSYVSIYRNLGWEVIEIEPADECPDGVFLEDAIIVFPNLASNGDAPATAARPGGLVVLPRSGSVERRKEYPSALRAVETYLVPRGYEVLDFNVVDSSGKATLDGGDVLKILPQDGQGSGSSKGKGVVYIGRSSRTNAEGFELMRVELVKRGWHVVPVPVENHLHLKSAITALPNGQIVGHPVLRSPTDAEPSIGLTVPSISTTTQGSSEPILRIKEEQGIAVVDVSLSPSHSDSTPSDQQRRKKGSSTLLLSAAARGTLDQLRNEEGYTEIHTVDITDFEKMEGCVTCLSVRVRTPAPLKRPS